MEALRVPETPLVQSTGLPREAGQPTSSNVAPKIAQAGLTTYKFAKHAKKWHSHASKLAGVFNPSLHADFGGGDSDDFDDSADSEDSDDDDDDDDKDDETYNEKDNETDSVYSRHSDDQSIHDDADTTTDNAHEQDSNTATHDSSSGGISSAAKGISKSLKTLPVTRAAKASELVPRGSPKVLHYTVSSPRSEASHSMPVESRTAIPTTVSAPKQPKDPKPEESKPSTAKQPHEAKEYAKEAALTQIVKVRRPDGTIVKVRRPIKPTPSGDAAKPTTETKPTAESNPTPKPTLESALHDGGIVFSPKLVREDATTTSEASKEVKPAIIVTEKEKAGMISSEELPKSPPAPTDAQNLARRTSRFAQITICSIMIALPLVFLILAILTASVTGKPANDSLGKRITQANKIAVSLWPIAYAALAAQALRMYASYKVERGLRLMTLEQLISSHSVASAIKQPFLLQRFTTTSLALLLLWSLSPLAGQAFLRMSTLGPSGALSNITLQYLDTAIEPLTFSGASTVGELGPSVNNLFGSCILSPLTSQTSPMDSWGNIKIPLTNSTSWTSIPSTNVSYASLLGVPVGSIPSSGNTTFTIPSAYFSFQQCTAITNKSLDEIITSVYSNPDMTLWNATSGTLHIAMVPPLPPASPQGILLYASSLNDTVAYTTCNFTQIFVETFVSCAGKLCYAAKTRSISSPPSTSDVGFDPRDLLDMMNGFTNAGAAIGTGTYTPTQLYIQDPSGAGINPSSAGVNDFIDPSTLPISIFTARLAVLINTYWLAGIAPYDFTGVLKTNEGVDVVPLNVNGTVASTASVYCTSWGWLVLLLFSTVLLLIGGVVGAYLDHHTIGPDIFGFASSLARKNKHIKFVDEEEVKGWSLPSSGAASGVRSGTMGGAERTRLLGDVRVMLKDVRPGKVVGRIELGSVDGGTVGERLRRGRLYK